ncbi:hypothetical protein CMI48_01420 [Candidatus Pacearchaeota archaeon]|nr:hypothetical protein [Candidatus Pacearchaeota archaeon]
MKTEFGEAIEKMRQFDADRTEEKKINFLFEVADILLQKELVELRYTKHPAYRECLEKLSGVLEYFAGELEKRGLALDQVRRLAEVKYGMRAWLHAHGFSGKDKALEFSVCLKELQREA